MTYRRKYKLTLVFCALLVAACLLGVTRAVLEPVIEGVQIERVIERDQHTLVLHLSGHKLRSCKPFFQTIASYVEPATGEWKYAPVTLVPLDEKKGDPEINHAPLPMLRQHLAVKIVSDEMDFSTVSRVVIMAMYDCGGEPDVFVSPVMTVPD